MDGQDIRLASAERHADPFQKLDESLRDLKAQVLRDPPPKPGRES